MDNSDLITNDPDILGGIPVFIGTRVPVGTLFDYLEDNYTLNEFIEYFPTVTRDIAVRVLERSKSAILASLCLLFLVFPVSSLCLADSAKIETLSPPWAGFFSKKTEVSGLPILAHADVSDAAIRECVRRLTEQISHNPPMAANLHANGVQMQIIGKDQECSDLPMYRHMKGKIVEGKLTFDQRGRGYGGLFSSCAEAAAG